MLASHRWTSAGVHFTASPCSIPRNCRNPRIACTSYRFAKSWQVMYQLQSRLVGFDACNRRLCVWLVHQLFRIAQGMRRTTAPRKQAFAHDAARSPGQKAGLAHDRVAPDAASCGALKAPWLKIDSGKSPDGLDALPRLGATAVGYRIQFKSESCCSALGI